MSKIGNRAGRALIAAATTLAIAAAGVPAANAASGMTSSERQECIDYLLPKFQQAGKSTFWDPEVDKELALTAKSGEGSLCSRTVADRFAASNPTDGEWISANRDGWNAVLAAYRAPLVATIVVPILALLGVGAWAVQQGLIPGL
ncbi:hypothetical protein HMPREF1219_02236 [Corynebacterium pyruviciproducens ATCC BAA-1742]|uniref:Secreted protein n=1 Tax=Corynebacterium pyruviciproducens ATCC BAA-1742 TaxID=1125779 RepID=S2YTU2_9CORY|nr:hypothetical protein [Corynebacterium pyruviciproducens]EPD67823.1 hypothetical protein HMPREF1219_02236 [Corynebacterium pyruviciproducens ATCC BAA-1742]